MPKPKKGPTFEKNLESLESIVGALEEGGLTLEDSLKRFEEGIRLAGLCEKTLTAAEKKIEKLTKSAGGTLEARPFGDDDGDEDQPEQEDEPEEPDDDGEMLF